MTNWKLTTTDTRGTVVVTEYESGCYAKHIAQSMWNFEEITRVTLEHGGDFYVVCREGYIIKIK